MKLLFENWRKHLNEFNPTGKREGEIYIKSLPLDNPDIEVYKRAVGQDIRGIAKVFKVEGGVIEMEYILPYSNSKGFYNIDRDARFEAIQCAGHDTDECMSDKLSDEQYDIASEWTADINSAANFIGVNPEFLDTNPANYGFVNRNGRDELVFLDLGGDK